MDNRAEVRDFLTTRRAKVSPEQAGLPQGGQRRVRGLRRSEVAALAGVSVEYYAKLERGALAGVSAPVLDGVARALRLDDAERTHLFALAQAADGTAALARPRRRSTNRWTARPSLQWTLESITAPAIVVSGRMDLLGANLLGRAMHSSLYESAAAAPESSLGAAPPNFARYTFLDSDAQRFYPQWDTAAAIAVAILRTTAGRDPHDKEMHDLVGELSTRSQHFRRLWATHDVRHHGSGTKHFHHTAVGELELAFESMAMVSEPGLNLTIYTADPGSATAERLRLLGSWAASQSAKAPVSSAGQQVDGQGAGPRARQSGHEPAEQAVVSQPNLAREERATPMVGGEDDVVEA
ncbi:helix-turn-helix domain-containing protein [Quadrisphaera sp. KR29]|uniref:helix-turn-helix domain-containing protein n=1 Tax=Quadrisphaera sp. KR29 TaxID=3461391 RepID=UPI0040439B3E